MYCYLSCDLLKVLQRFRFGTVVIHYDNFVVLVVGIPFDTFKTLPQQLAFVAGRNHDRYQRLVVNLVTHLIQALSDGSDACVLSAPLQCLIDRANVLPVALGSTVVRTWRRTGFIMPMKQNLGYVHDPIGRFNRAQREVVVLAGSKASPQTAELLGKSRSDYKAFAEIVRR